MALRARVKTELALRDSFAAGAPITSGDEVVFGADDNTVVPSALNDDLAIGIALSDALAGKRVQVALYGNAIVEMTVGTGGATRGRWQWKVVDGVTDAPPNGGGTRAISLVGRAMQTGLTGDRIGVLIGSAHRAVSV